MDNFSVMTEVQGARIKVIGAGGGGSNAVRHMVDSGVVGVDFAIMNTDIQAIHESSVKEKIQIGYKLTKGLGAGANPEIGRRAAEESIEEIKNSLKGYDLVFLAVGLGGGSGTGSAPVIAQVARDMGILTVAVVTLPFGTEGRTRMMRALDGKKSLAEHVDTMITIPNDRLSAHYKHIGKKMNMRRALAEVDNVLLQAVQGITDLINKPGVINLDFADIRTIMTIRGSSLMGVGVGTGDDKVRIATEQAIRNPFLTHGIEGAKGIIVNVAGNDDLDFEDFEMVNQIITSQVSDEAEIMVGTVIDDSIPSDTIQVTIVATGFDEVTNVASNSVPLVSRSEQQVRPAVSTNTAPAPAVSAQTNSVPFERSAEMIRAEKERAIEERIRREVEAEMSRQRQEESVEDFATKEVNSIFDTLDLPPFMKNMGR